MILLALGATAATSNYCCRTV